MLCYVAISSAQLFLMQTGCRIVRVLASFGPPPPCLVAMKVADDRSSETDGKRSLLEAPAQPKPHQHAAGWHWLTPALVVPQAYCARDEIESTSGEPASTDYSIHDQSCSAIRDESRKERQDTHDVAQDGPAQDAADRAGPPIEPGRTGAQATSHHAWVA